MAETKYNKVKSWIKSKILDGTFKPTQKISSESELMKQFEVSRHTVRIAIGELVSEGWLYKEQGAGTFCADRSGLQSQIIPVHQKKIAIITTYISDYIFPSIIRGAESKIREEGYQVSLFSTNNDHENERAILEMILSQQFDGVIIEPTRSATYNPNINYFLNLELLGIPYIMINAYYDELEPVSVTVNDEKGGFMQAEHLINLGHRNILGFFKTDDMQGTRRMKGFIKALRTNEIPVRPQNIITYSTAEKTSKPLEYLSKALTEAAEKPTAIVCYNDELALKLLDVIRAENLVIPEDLSIIGYDNSFIADISEVKLTSIDHPKSDLGKMAAQMILDMINDKNTHSVESFVFEPEIVLRNSTKAISAEQNSDKLKDLKLG